MKLWREEGVVSKEYEFGDDDKERREDRVTAVDVVFNKIACRISGK